MTALVQSALRIPTLTNAGTKLNVSAERQISQLYYTQAQQLWPTTTQYQTKEGKEEEDVEEK